ncbi:PAAR-like domain-containing protein [Serratia microhaemolytica]|uniref:PAAR-like domain-containing protein n=1 Tax=Serratia microhaemolytica TaxID=2675110 RepID=UPI000FDE6FCC|nr:PAAR-like domain-containing protein [Serratia microhaemolytica]
MSTHVYINNHEACSKSSRGASNGAFPDPCWSPPSPPAGPVVIPYPNSSKASDLTKGTSTVFIKRSMVAKEDRSYFATSTGNEGATQAFNKGVATSKITGKTYFVKWSQNVKFEGCCVPRDIDLTTHNHGSKPGNSATFPYLSKREIKKHCKKEQHEILSKCKPNDKPAKEGWHWTQDHCEGLNKKFISQDQAVIESAAKLQNNNSAIQIQRFLSDPRILKKALDITPSPIVIDGISYTHEQIRKQRKDLLNNLIKEQEKAAEKNPCLKARKCQLVPYSLNGKQAAEKDKLESSTQKGCCTAQTGHHLVYGSMVKDCPDYKHNLAPTVCVEGNSWHKGSHKTIHEIMDEKLLNHIKQNGPLMKMDEAVELAAEAHEEVFPNCSKECIKAQLNGYYNQLKSCIARAAPAITKNKEEAIELISKKDRFDRKVIGGKLLIKNRLNSKR